MFNLGIQAEKIHRKPYIPMLKENNVRTGFFEHGEFVALRGALPDYLQPVATLAYFTGWRQRNILDLMWNQVDLDARTVRLNPGTTKNDAGQLVILDGELLEAIQKQWERRKVVTRFSDNPLPCSALLFFTRTESQSKIFGMPGIKARETTGLASKILHDFRRTVVRDMVRAGVHERVAMIISGHKTRSVFDRYNIVSEDDLKEAARRHAAHVQNLEKTTNVVQMKASQR